MTHIEQRDREIAATFYEQGPRMGTDLDKSHASWVRSERSDGDPFVQLVAFTRASLTPPSVSTELLREAREGLQVMLDAYLDFHDANHLTQAVTGAANNAFEKALAARDALDAHLASHSASVSS
jgi:hypothetical protein